MFQPISSISSEEDVQKKEKYKRQVVMNKIKSHQLKNKFGTSLAQFALLESNLGTSLKNEKEDAPSNSSVADGISIRNFHQRSDAASPLAKVTLHESTNTNRMLTAALNKSNENLKEIMRILELKINEKEFLVSQIVKQVSLIVQSNSMEEIKLVARQLLQYLAAHTEESIN